MEESLSIHNIFNMLSGDKIEALGDLFSEDAITNPVGKSNIKKIVGDGFPDDDILYLERTFLDFVTNRSRPAEISRWANAAGLDDGKKTLLLKVVQGIRDKTEQKKIDLNLHANMLQFFGHPHLHSAIITTEFRPITHFGKIIKIVPSLVVCATIHALSLIHI